jgi:hypothetical protein
MASHGLRVVVAAGVLAILLIAGSFTPLPGPMYLLDAVLLVLTFGVPAWWIGGPMDVVRAWPSLLAWVAALTAVWDVASAAIANRAFFSEWWLVYPTSVVFFSALYLFQGWVVQLSVRRGPSRKARRSSRP